MKEIIPMSYGLVLGGAVASMPGRLSRVLMLVGALVLGVAASAVTGELKVSWAFVIIDVPLVAVSAVVGVAIGRAAQKAWSTS